jgi:diguanylate cyclase (GGDEF)-like protein/PAS domain S-box-containing protein
MGSSLPSTAIASARAEHPIEEVAPQGAARRTPAPDPARHRRPARVRGRVLERLAQGAELEEVLDLLVREIEAGDADTWASILLLDDAGQRLHVAAAPSLPREYNQALEGVAIGPDVGSCGTAAWHDELVIVSDIATDPLWKDYRDLALSHGLRACWSQPIRSSMGQVLGTFAMYYGSARVPLAGQLQGIAEAAHVASIAIERARADKRIARLTNLSRARSEISKFIVRTTCEADLLAQVCRVAVQFGGMHLAWIGAPGASDARVVALASYGRNLEYLKDLNVTADPGVPEGRGPIGRALRSGDCVIVNDFDANSLMDPWRQRAKDNDFRSGGSFAIHRSGRVFAVLVVYSDRAGSFDEEAIGLLREIAGDVGFALGALDRAREHAEAVDALSRSEQQLRERNEFLNSILQSEPECVKVVAPDGKLLQMNRAGLQMLGVGSVEEARACGLLEFVLPGYRRAFQDLHARVCRGESGVIEFEIRGRDGVQRWLETHATPLRAADGRVGAVLGVTRDISEKKRSEALIWRQANFDILTGLPNRYMFQERLAHEIAKGRRAGLPVALMFIDLDEFKEVNDTLGHESGDALLVAVAQRIRSCVRESDTVARLGGDEFTVILPGLVGADVVERVSECIIARLGEVFNIRNEAIFLSASIGVTYYPHDATTVDDMLKNADQAMYLAKRQGRNRVGYFTAELQEAAQNRLRLINDLRGALAAGQFAVHFQPIVQLASRRICGAEALLRWRHPTQGDVSPKDFIPLAEQTGFIVPIGDWVFRESARWAKRWAGQVAGDFRVGVNNSAVQFRHGQSILSWLEHLRDIGLPGRNMSIEITESLLLEADAPIGEVLHRLHESGMRVAIDDFGTGFSSLSYLHKFEIDCLKIDQTFVRDLQTQASARALSESIIAMAHKLGLTVVAEGVERQEQLDFLVAAGCDFAQGYLFSRPVPPEQFDQLLRDGLPPPGDPR